MNGMRSLLRLQLTLAALALLAAPALQADGFIVVPRPPRPGPASPFPLEVTRHDVQVTIDGQLATTAVDQEFFNPNPSRLEGYYLFPLPAGAAIRDFSMWIDGRQVHAELLDAAKARGIYEDIVRRLRDPALLEYDGRGVFKMRVFPIEPRGRKRIQISYHEVLEKSHGAVSYSYPLATEKYSARPIPQVSITAAIHSPTPLASIHCPSHEVEIKRPARGRATVRYVGRDLLPDRDFRLFFTPATGPLGFSLQAFRPAGQDGFFFFSVAPTFAGSDEAAAKDITLIVDTSGSMAGRAMQQAQGAINGCLQRLRRDDRFNLIRFSTEAEALFLGPAPATAANVARAREFVAGWQAAGGTNCEEALKLALESPAGRELAAEARQRPRIVVLVTDGRPTIGETGDEALLALVGGAGRERLRLFPVAIGSEINTHLLDGLAERTRAFRTYLGLHEDIEGGIARFYERISSPVMSDVRLEISGSARIRQVHPRDLPDLFLGSTLTVVGRYQSPGPAVFILRGTVNGRSQEFTFRAELPAVSLDHDFLPPLWAARRVGYLLDQVRLRGESRELVDEVTRLAREYGIVTPYTSYLIVEDEQQRRSRGELAERDMTLGAAPGAPAMALEQERQFRALREKSGAASVMASKHVQQLRQALDIAQAQAGGSGQALVQPRLVQGQAFYFSGGAWVDARLQGRGRQALQRLAFASPEYFALLRQQPQLAPVLAQGRRVRFVAGGQAYEVFDPGVAGG